MQVDIAIVGGGVVGGSLARALAGSGLQLALIEPRAARDLPKSGFDTRVYALNPRSLRFLDGCGVMQRLAAERIAPIREMHITGDDGSAHLEFNAYRSHVLELAAIVEESNLQQALDRALADQADLSLRRGLVCDRVDWSGSCAGLTLSDGSSLGARLVIAADGAESKLRSAAAIETRIREYRQKGVVANFRIGKAHRDVAHQWFRQDGVLALLPLPGDQVSMVWSAAEDKAATLLAMSADELARAVESAADRALGAMELSGTVAAFALRRMRAKRLIAPRLALVGDAAHNVHPLAGQGLNLGLADAEALAGILLDRGMEADAGVTSLLRRYERGRREDILAMECVTDGLQKLFTSTLPGVATLRNAGLGVADRISPLKRILVKRALG
jgi:2-polyprenylphenol 6-hydroxylase